MKTNESFPKIPPFPNFIARYGTPEFIIPWKDSNISLPDNFPKSLVEHWHLYGFGSYGEGLIWMHPPSMFAFVIEEWTGLTLKDAILITRHSFGDFTMWAQGRIYFINVRLGQINELPEEIDFLFEDILCDDEFLDNFLRRPLHCDCVKQLRNISAEECFGFVPALPLGGMEEARSVEIVKMREHLAFLAQLKGQIRI